MNNYDGLLKEYENSGDDKRMNLYLYYRECRNTLREIEFKEIENTKKLKNIKIEDAIMADKKFSKKEYEKLINDCMNAWSKADVELTASFYSDDLEYRDPMVPQGIIGKEEFIKYLKAVFKVWPRQKKRRQCLGVGDGPLLGHGKHLVHGEALNLDKLIVIAGQWGGLKVAGKKNVQVFS